MFERLEAQAGVEPLENPPKLALKLARKSTQIQRGGEGRGAYLGMRESLSAPMLVIYHV